MAIGSINSCKVFIIGQYTIQLEETIINIREDEDEFFFLFFFHSSILRVCQF
jgi:hypothetical protein